MTFLYTFKLYTLLLLYYFSAQSPTTKGWKASALYFASLLLCLVYRGFLHFGWRVSLHCSIRECPHCPYNPMASLKEMCCCYHTAICLLKAVTQHRHMNQQSVNYKVYFYLMKHDNPSRIGYATSTHQNKTLTCRKRKYSGCGGRSIFYPYVAFGEGISRKSFRRVCLASGAGPRSFLNPQWGFWFHLKPLGAVEK